MLLSLPKKKIHTLPYKEGLLIFVLNRNRNIPYDLFQLLLYCKLQISETDSSRNFSNKSNPFPINLSHFKY